MLRLVDMAWQPLDVALDAALVHDVLTLRNTINSKIAPLRQLLHVALSVVCCSVMCCECCSVLLWVAAGAECGVLQCVAGCCILLQCVAVWCRVLPCVAICCRWHSVWCIAVCCTVLQVALSVVCSCVL